jgi:hypothetical protein
MCMQGLFYNIRNHIVIIHCSGTWIAHILYKSNDKVLEILAMKSENLGDIYIFLIFSFVLSDSAFCKKH